MLVSSRRILSMACHHDDADATYENNDEAHAATINMTQMTSHAFSIVITIIVVNSIIIITLRELAFDTDMNWSQSMGEEHFGHGLAQFGTNRRTHTGL